MDSTTTSTVADLMVRFNADVAPMERKMAEANRVMDKTGAEAQRMSGRIAKSVRDNEQAFKTAGAAIAGFGLAIVTFFGLATAEAIKFESSFAGVRKTVDASEAEFNRLEASFRGLSREIPISVHEINGIGEAAGQLGIEKQNIVGFTATMADLGVATNMASEEAASSLARLANITQMPQTEFDRLGSTVVDLGNNLATTEAEIVEMGLRIAGAGSQVGLTEAQILGLGAALSSVGINAEAGGTAISKVMIDMSSEVETGGEKLAGFAEVAGMTAEEFATRFREDAAGALVAFVTGLGTMEERGGSTLGVLEELEITEVRMRDALLRASGAGDLMAESIQRGTDAWGDNVALTEEAEQRYKTTESQIQLAKNAVGDMAISVGGVLAPAVAGAAGIVADFAGFIADLPAPALAAGTAVGGVVGVVSLLGGTALMVLPRVIALNDALRTVGGVMGGIKTAGGGLVSFMTGPWGLALGAATLAIGYFWVQHRQAEERIDAVTATLDEQTGAITENTREWVAHRLVQEEMHEAASKLGLSFETVVDAAMGSAPAMALVAERTREARDEATAGVVVQQEQFDAARKLEGAVGGLASATAESTRRWREDQEALAEAEGRYFDVAHAVDGGLDPALARLAIQQQTATEAGEGLTDEQRELAAQAGVSEDAIAGLGGELGANAEAAEEALKALEQYMETLSGTLDAYAQFSDVSGTYQQLLDDENAKRREWAEEQADATKTAKDSADDFYKEVAESAKVFVQALQEDLEAQRNYYRNLDTVREEHGAEVAAWIAAQTRDRPQLLQAMVDAEGTVITDAFTLDRQRRDEHAAYVLRELNRSGQQLVDDTGRLTAAAVEVLAAELGVSEQHVHAIFEDVNSGVETQLALLEVVAGEGAAGVVRQIVAKLDAGAPAIARVVQGYGEMLAAGLNPVIRSVDGRPIAYDTSDLRNAQTGARGRELLPFAGGGLFLPDQARIQPPGTLIQWAEPETGGEAFIPLSPGKRPRAIEVWEETGRRLGVDPEPTAAFAGGGFRSIDDVPAVTATPAGWFGDAGRDAMTHTRDLAVEWLEANLAPPLTAGIGSQAMMAALRTAFPGLPLISGYRPGAITATGNPSYHGMDRAVDIPPRTDVNHWIYEHYKAQTRELIGSWPGAMEIRNGQDWDYSGITEAMHWDHNHWALARGGIIGDLVRGGDGAFLPVNTFDRGGFLPKGASVAVNNTGAREPVGIDYDRLGKAIAKAMGGQVGPAVAIDHAEFREEADLDMLFTRAEFAATARRPV